MCLVQAQYIKRKDRPCFLSITTAIYSIREDILLEPEISPLKQIYLYAVKRF
jgi:hypothetical protein